jgi:hypothetical protein
MELKNCVLSEDHALDLTGWNSSILLLKAFWSIWVVNRVFCKLIVS